MYPAQNAGPWKRQAGSCLRIFANAFPTAWNALPPEIRRSRAFTSFPSLFTRHLFNEVAWATFSKTISLCLLISFPHTHTNTRTHTHTHTHTCTCLVVVWDIYPTWWSLSCLGHNLVSDVNLGKFSVISVSNISPVLVFLLVLLGRLCHSFCACPSVLGLRFVFQSLFLLLLALIVCPEISSSSDSFLKPIACVLSHSVMSGCL